MRDSIELVFQGHLLWLSPLVLLGITWGNPARRSFAALPVLVYLLPFLVSFATGYVGWPRVYLFNLPLFAIFFAAGVVRLSRLFSRQQLRSGLVFGLTGVYALLCIHTLTKDYYPNIKTAAGKDYLQGVRKNSDLNDLIMISEINQYLYARRVFVDNLKNIFDSNRLSGVKAVFYRKADPDVLGVYDGSRDGFRLFRNQFALEKLPAIDVTGGNLMTSLTANASVSLLPEDFESRADWMGMTGNAGWFVETDHFLSGRESLRVEGDRNSNVAFEASIPNEVVVSKTSLVVIVWAWKNLQGFNDDSSIYTPALLVSDAGEKRRLKMGIVNHGMGIYFFDKVGVLKSYQWSLEAVLGLIPPGKYNFSVLLPVSKGNSVLYDGFRMFIIEKSG